MLFFLMIKSASNEKMLTVNLLILTEHAEMIVLPTAFFLNSLAQSLFLGDKIVHCDFIIQKIPRITGKTANGENAKKKCNRDFGVTTSS